MLFTFNNSNKLNSEMRSTVVNAFNKNENAKNSNSYQNKMHMDGKFKSISGRDYIYYKKLLLTQRNMKK